MSWFTETIWPPLIVLAAGALALTALWQQRKQAVYLGGVAAIALACVAIYFVELRIVTPREEVEQAVLEITRAYQQGDAVATKALISRQALNLQALAARAIEVVRVAEDMRISDISTQLSSKETRATTRFRLNATISLNGPNSQEVYRDFQPTRWESTWQREKEGWKLIKIQELDPITGEELDRVNVVSQGISGVGAN